MTPTEVLRSTRSAPFRQRGTKMTNMAKRWPGLLMFSGLLVVLFSSTARAQQLSVRPVSTEVAVTGDTLQATFKIEVVNSETAAMTHFVVVFEDGTYIE